MIADTKRTEIAQPDLSTATVESIVIDNVEAESLGFDCGTEMAFQIREKLKSRKPIADDDLPDAAVITQKRPSTIGRITMGLLVVITACTAVIVSTHAFG